MHAALSAASHASHDYMQRSGNGFGYDYDN